MEIILYSNDCPRCRVLKKKLGEKNVEFSVQNDMARLAELGITELPVIETKGDDGSVFMQFAEAVKWANGLPGGESVQEEVPHFCATCRLDPDSVRR